LRELLDQVFREVRVRGLFGTPTLYETEIRRVDAARRRIRRKDEAARQAEARAEARETASKGISAMATGAARPLPIRIARRVLPRAVRGWLRSMVAPRSAPTSPSEPVTAAVMAPPPDASQMAFERFLEFTVADLFYADRDLDRAMDLLAICRVGE